jgi:hypothetical protein
MNAFAAGDSGVLRWTAPMGRDNGGSVGMTVVRRMRSLAKSMAYVPGKK